MDKKREFFFLYWFIDWLNLQSKETLEDTVMAYEMQNRFLNKEVLELNQLRQQAIDRSALGPRKQWFIFFKQKNISSGGLHPQHFYFDMFPSSTLKIGEKYIYFIYLYTYNILLNLDNNACMVFSTLSYYLTNWRKLYILIFYIYYDDRVLY